jgi:hypothetical protein
MAYDPQKIFCSDSCEAYLTYHNKSHNIHRATEDDLIAARAKKQERGRARREKARLAKADQPASDTKKVSLQRIMYADTFKPYVPKSLRVMRG